MNADSRAAANDDRFPPQPGSGTARAWKIGAGVALGAAAVALAYRGRSGKHASEREVAYPPLDTPKSVAPGIWIVDGAPIAAMGLTIPVRMTVVRLENGDLLLHSPTHYMPGLAKTLETLGRIRHLVAPNIAHWTFLKPWQDAYPDATTWGVPGLRDRRQVRESGVRIDRDLQDAPEAEWAGELGQGIVPGAAGFQEAYFFHKASRTLLLVDLVENLQPDKLPPLTRAVMGAAGATDGTTARYLRVLIRWNGEEAAAKIRGLIELDPERVIVSHGAIFAERGADRLRHAFAWLLGAAGK
jgi:hypothetical protein